MKKVLLIAAAILACVTVSAQSRGDKYIAGSLGASFGSQTARSYDGAYTTSQSQPLTTTVSIQAEFGYFVADNLRLALCIGAPFTSTPSQLSGSTWLKTNTIGFQINPNIAYYVRLTDRLYYTPEIGFSYEIGSYKEDMTTSTTYNASYNGWDVYANLLALEFQVNPKFAIGVGIGSISYGDVKIKDKSSSAYLSNAQLRFNLNDAAVHARFYF